MRTRRPRVVRYFWRFCFYGPSNPFFFYRVVEFIGIFGGSVTVTRYYRCYFASFRVVTVLFAAPVIYREDVNALITANGMPGTETRTNCEVGVPCFISAGGYQVKANVNG